MFSKTPITPSSVEILNKVVSYQKNTWSAFSKEMTIGEVLKEQEEEDANRIESKPRQIIHFNKPFSYFYQVIERKGNNETI